jgi:3-deoxy-manno-octulosonate cytidylyltransferase (CMP-KDO synthetase)
MTVVGGSPKVLVVIPARYGSTRLAAKALADIHGKPMVRHVWERSKSAGHRVVVATDDERIASVVAAFGGEAVMTSTEIRSGTDRVAAVADQIEADIYASVQGDEPLMVAEAIQAAVNLVATGRFPLSTVMTPLVSREELNDPSVVKVLADRSDRAVYFSRHPIPYSRLAPPETGFACRRHVGLYVYDRETLMRFRDLPTSEWERAESLEQLRALEHGIPIGIREVAFTSIGVDTPEDLEKVRRHLVGRA